MTAAAASASTRARASISTGFFRSRSVTPSSKFFASACAWRIMTPRHSDEIASRPCSCRRSHLRGLAITDAVASPPTFEPCELMASATAFSALDRISSYDISDGGFQRFALRDDVAALR